MAKVVFVDKNENPIGAGTRQEASEKGLIARVARIFVFNSKSPDDFAPGFLFAFQAYKKQHTL